MAITVTHPFVSAVADGGDATVVRPSNWNATHSLSGTVDIANGGTGSSTSAGAPFALKGVNTDLTSVALTSGTVSTVPSAAFDLANKAYVDTLVAGLNFHVAAQYATAAALAANTYNNGTAGVGATLTGNAVGALTVDSNVVVVAQRILVKNEVAGANNGVYVVTTVGNGSTAYVLTRAADYNTVGTSSNQIGAGDYIYVTAGTVNINTAWVQQTPAPITIGTTSIVFIQFGVTGAGGTNTQVQYNASGVFAGSANLTFNGTTLSANALSLTNALGVAYGGTNITSYAVGDLLYASATGALSKLADVATGNALISGGVGVAPSYGKVGLTTHVSGTLPIANGGTNSTATATAGGAGYGTGTAHAYTAAGTSGQVLTSAGASAPTWATPTTGTVTAVSVVSANGLAGTSSGGATPALTLSTSITGLLKGNGTAISAATAGTDYLTPTTGVTTFSGSSTGLTPSTATSGAITLAGTLAVANGGTNITTYAIGDLIYASTTGVLSKLADVATGNSLISGGVGVAPSYGKVGLTTHVSGTLPVANGGTNITTYAIGDLIYASTAGVLSKLADVATGNALISGGVGVAPSYGKIALTTHVSGTLPVANGGTGLASGTSGGVLAFTATGTIASSAALAASALVIGGGAGVAPSTTTTATGALTFLGTPSSANLAALLTDETGSGVNVFATSPTFTTSMNSGVTFTAFAGATTLLTIGGTGATSVFAVPGTLEQSSTTGAMTVAGGVYIAKKLTAIGGISGGTF